MNKRLTKKRSIRLHTNNLHYVYITQILHQRLVTSSCQQIGEFSHYYRPEEIYHYRHGYLNHIQLRSAQRY